MLTKFSENLVNIAVCGKFHYLQYIPFMENSILNHVFCSTRPSFIKALPDNIELKVVNPFLKQYLTHGHLRYLKRIGYDKLSPLYVDYWQRRCLSYWSSAPIFHFMLHGNCLKLIHRAKNEGSIIIGEPVNAHPNDIFNRLMDEYSLLGIKHFPRITLLQPRMNEEASLCDVILSPSQSVTDSYVSQGFPTRKLKTLNFGADLTKFFPDYKPEVSISLTNNNFQLICVASINPRKGHIYLLEAWKRLKLNNARLLLIGSVDPCMRPTLSRYSDLFTHKSRVPNHELRTYYNSSDAFALTSIEDGFAYVVTEAMACGLPVIVSDAVGASDLIQEGKTGFIVKSRCIDDVMKAIQCLYDSRLLRISMGEAARQSVYCFHSWENYASILNNYYLSLVNG